MELPRVGVSEGLPVLECAGLGPDARRRAGKGVFNFFNFSFWETTRDVLAF